MRKWRVLIVEDDRAVAYVHRRMLERHPAFKPVATAETGEDALVRVERDEPDLVLLDLALRGMNGVGFLARARAKGHRFECIALTATRSARVVRTTAQLGVLDYIVKPFTQERFLASLSLFLGRNAALDQGPLDQSAIDTALRGAEPHGRSLPKGLHARTLARVRGCLSTASTELSAMEVSERLGVSRVTARRYLEHLAGLGQVRVDLEYHGPGRPIKRYELVAPDAFP